MKIAIILQPTKGVPRQKYAAAVGEIFDGKDALDIVYQMKSGSMFTDCLTIDEYLDLVKKMIFRFYKKRIKLRGVTNLAKAEGLMKAMKEIGLALEIH